MNKDIFRGTQLQSAVVNRLVNTLNISHNFHCHGTLMGNNTCAVSRQDSIKLSSEKDKAYNNDHCSNSNNKGDNSYATYLELHALNKILSQVHNPITIHSQTECAHPLAKQHFIV